MTDEQRPTHVLKTEAVRWSLDLLAGRKIHPTFLFYLYLRQHAVDGHLDRASPSSQELLDLIRMPGGPPDKPYYRPFRERGHREGQLLRNAWQNRNVAGSWSPKSLARQVASAWLVDAAGSYTLPHDHVARARSDMLFGTTAPAVAFGAYLLRNDGFMLDGDGTSTDIVAGLKAKFRFDSSHEPDFLQLFEASAPANLTWFEEWTQ